MSSEPREIIASRIMVHEIVTEDGDTVSRDGVAGWPCSCGYFQPMRDGDDVERSEWHQHEADAILEALADSGWEIVRLEQVGPFVCKYHGGVDWCERDNPDREPVYRKVTGETE